MVFHYILHKESLPLIHQLVFKGNPILVLVVLELPVRVVIHSFDARHPHFMLLRLQMVDGFQLNSVQVVLCG